MEKWENAPYITQWIFAALFFILLLVIMIIMLARENFRKIEFAKIKEEKVRLEHQQELLENNIAVQEQERDRIAAEIHDSLIGRLATVQLQNKVNYNTKEIDSGLKEAISIARKLSHDLSLPMIEHTDIEELIDDLLHPWRTVFYIKYTCDVRGNRSLPYVIKSQLVKIVQELITNVHKHAGAGEVVVHLRQTQHLLFLKLSDNGCGFDSTTGHKGLGLKNLEYRVQCMKAHYRLRSSAKGTGYLIYLKNYNSEN